MGTNYSSLTQSTSNLSSLLKQYTILTKQSSQNHTIVKDKITNQLFIIKSINFTQKNLFEKHLCRYNHFQETQQSQNILNLHKVWIEEHTNFCSNSYKIFPMYEYSDVTLLDEMEARKKELKYFQEQELLGIIQSCINAFTFQSPILLSPKELFIVSDGLLKINNADLFDSDCLESYVKGVYYSPEKMQNFTDSSFYENDQNYIKQTIFSLGLTLLSAIILEDLNDKVYCLQNLNKKVKLNLISVFNQIDKLNTQNLQVSPQLLQLIKRMVHNDPKKRPSLFQLQEQIETISRFKKQIQQISVHSVSVTDPQNVLKNIDLNMNPIQQNGAMIFRTQNLSTIYDKNFQNLSTFRNKLTSQNSQYEFLKQFSQKHNPIQKQYQENDYKSQVYVPMVISTQIQQQQQIIDKSFMESNENEKELPCIISRENPLFTNPQFLEMMNEEIKRFKYQKKSPFASTQISRQNSNIFLLRQSQIQN